MGKVDFENFEAWEQELLLWERELKSLDLEVENLTRDVENDESGRDWKALSSGVIKQNDSLRGRIWALKVVRRNIENRIFSIRKRIACVDEMWLF